MTLLSVGGVGRAHSRWILSAYHCGQGVSVGIKCELVLTMVFYVVMLDAHADD